MYPSVNKLSKEIETITELKRSATLDERTDDVSGVCYPLSFLLLESEEDCFVKGYN